MSQQKKIVVLIVLFLLIEVYRLIYIIPFQLVNCDIYIPMTEDLSCVIITDENLLNQYTLKSMLTNVDFNFTDNSYIISPGRELRKIKKESLQKHFVRLYLNSQKTNQIFIYKVKNKKIYLNDRSGNSIIYQ